MQRRVEEKDDIEIGEKKKSKAKVEFKEEPLVPMILMIVPVPQEEMILKSFLTQVQMMTMLLILVLLMNLLGLIYLVLVK